MMFGFGGYGGRYDDELGSKIARFKDKHAKPSDKYDDFLRYDLGVDPKDIPYTVQDAHDELARLLVRYGADEFTLTGNSLQLTSVTYGKETVDSDTVAWDIFVKAHAAFVRDSALKGVYSFRVTRDDYLPIIANEIDEQPFSYPVGTVLSISDGTKERYVRVGSFQNDDELMDTDTFEAVENPETYKVIEVIQ